MDCEEPKKLVQTLRPIRSASIEINGEQITLDPDIPDRAQAILDAINGH